MKEVAIKEICTKGSSSLKQKELLPEGKYPVYGASGIAGYLDTFHQGSNYIGIVKDGSGIGRVAFYPEKTSLIGTMQYILPKKGFNIRYIGYCLQSLDLSKYKQGAAIPHIYFRDYGERIVKVTDDENEQLSIVSRLDAAFAHIDALKANAEKQLAEARQLFQAELAECMRPKEGWEEKKIKDVGEVIGGTTPSTSNSEFWGGDICWISPAELHGEHYLYDSVKKITPKAVAAKSLKELPEGTVILSSRAPIGKIAINKVPMYCNQGFKCVVCGPELFNEYLYWWFYGKKDYLNSLGTGATFPEISKTVVEDIVIPIAPMNEQQSIVSHLDALSANIKKLEEVQRKTLAECDALKQAMLREVFE